jgi:hypothetical protein
LPEPTNPVTFGVFFTRCHASSDISISMMMCREELALDLAALAPFISTSVSVGMRISRTPPPSPSLPRGFRFWRTRSSKPE